MSVTYGWVVQLGDGKLARWVESDENGTLTDDPTDAYVYNREDWADHIARQWLNGARVVPLVGRGAS